MRDDSKEVKVRLSANRFLGNYLHFIGNSEFDDFHCRIDKITAAYFVINQNHKKYLILFASRDRKLIPLKAEGFEKVYTQLSAYFGFDDDLFFSNKDRNQALKISFWHKHFPQNYRFTKTHHQDISKGFEVLSPTKKFIPWDLPIKQLKKQKDLLVKRTSPGSRRISFKYPVRIGNLIIDELCPIFSKNRLDAPVPKWCASCLDKTNSDHSLRELEAHLKSYPSLKLLHSWGNTQKHQQFSSDGLCFEIYYQYIDEYSFEDGRTHFSITNTRDYPDLLRDRKYEKQLSVDELILLPKGISIDTNYMQNPRIKRLPSSIEKSYEKQNLIWRDDKNQKIGFGGGGYIQVFSKKEIKYFLIQNTLPAKGSGYAYFSIRFKRKSTNYRVLTGDCHAFDALKKKIERLTGKKVAFGPESMNV